MSQAAPVEPKHRPRRGEPPKPLAVTVDDACHITGLGRSKVYELISEGKLRAVVIGGRRVVIYSSIEDLIHGAAA